MANFSVAPTVNHPRSKFPIDFTHKTSFNVGQLVPIDVQEILPGDTFSVDCAGIARVTSGFIKVPMDNLYLDIYSFFVPNRLVWKHWKEFMGENTSGAYVPSTEYTVPTVDIDGSLEHNTILSHMFGVVEETDDIPQMDLNALPLRAYVKIWNEFFRDENLQAPVLEVDDETSVSCSGFPSANYMDAYTGSTILPVDKFHDYFTSALKDTQKGNPVTISLTGDAPVLGYDLTKVSDQPLKFTWAQNSGSEAVPGYYSLTVNGQSGTTNNVTRDGAVPEGVTTFARGFDPNQRIGTAQLSNISLVTINELRTAFQLQRFLEIDSRSGTRYIETLKAHFGTTSPDYRLQRPEYLGHLRTMINVDQVLQTSATGATGTQTAQGNVSGYSLTGFKGNLYTKSFTEHGFVITLAAVRYKHTYQTGINKMWFRKSKYDYYWPVFANLGEQPIYNKELFCKSAAYNDQVFGYQEAWAEYRYKPDMISGQLNSGDTTSLDMWHFGDKYNVTPVLSAAWIQEDKNNVNRTINVSSDVADQFIFDFVFKGSMVRVMPTYSIPGLIDHN